MQFRLASLHKNVWGGTLMVALGGGVVWQSLQYRVGSLRVMGPGYFPLVLGIILIATGVIIAIQGSLAAPRPAATEKLAPQWKAWALISLGIIAFVVLAQYFGLVPATFAVVFISALGDHGNSWRAAAVLAIAIVAVAVAVFWWGLQVQLPLFRWPPFPWLAA
ncbi:MAG: tripartite tricarboxylate transporter TctB family protein [Alphaproteobacteria bacterium]|nr:tripartite tricarboxylate transporter TctB family protein [Alphaproteobacteria bacterium]